MADERFDVEEVFDVDDYLYFYETLLTTFHPGASTPSAPPPASNGQTKRA